MRPADLYNSLWCAALLAALALGTAADASAQPETVGSIEEMRSGHTSIDSTGDVRLTSTPAYARKSARRQDALHMGELVELIEPYYVRATLDYGAMRTRLYAGSSGARIDAIELQQRGAYEIRPGGVDPLSGLELRIRHGVIVVEHTAGRLDTWVRGTLMQVFGTTVLLATDSTSADAFCFLQEGHVAFPNYGLDFRGKNVAWRLREGLPPERFDLGLEERQHFRREVKLITHEVWRGPRPFWQKPKFYIPMGAAVFGAGFLLVTSGGNDSYRPDDRFDGGVTIRVP